MFKLTRALALALTGVAMAATPAMASETVIVDGVERPASELAALKGKLNVVQAEAGKPAVAFTKKADFKAYLKKNLNVDITKKPAAMKKKTGAKASWYGDYADFYQHGNGQGWRMRIDSGYGISDLHHVGCFLWICGDNGDQISSVRTFGRAAVLFSEVNYRGTSYYVGANQHHEIAWWFNDTASSALVHW